MNFILFFLVSGQAFFGGVGLIMAGLLLLSWKKRKQLKIFAVILPIIGVFLIVFSGTPIPLWLFFSWMAFLVFWLLIEIFRPSLAGKRGLVIRGLAFVFTLGILFCEIPYRITPSISGKHDTIYIIGDSISAGISNDEQTWPKIIEKSYRVKVVNLAQAGATVQSAKSQINGIIADHSLVIIEIGGNDLLGKTPASQFESAYEVLIRSAKDKAGTIVMLELPVLPFRGVYGRIQRRLSKKYDIALIPKKYFAEVLFAPGATVDGIHLSASGHQKMADMIWNFINASIVVEQNKKS